MSQEVIAAILGSAIVLLGGAVGFILSKIFSMDGRLIKIETLFEMWSKTTAIANHSPHTEKYDAMAKKYYTDGLSVLEWEEFVILCLEIEKDETNSSEKRAQCWWLRCFAATKLGKPLPDPVEHRIQV